MVVQYPHSISVTVKTAATQNDLSGVWTPGTTTVHTFDCRAELNGRGIKIAGHDGVLLEYAYIVYMPLHVVVIPFNSDTVLTMGAETYSGKVKNSYNGQLNSRLWL